MKQPYVKPVLTRQLAGVSSKFPPLAASRFMDAIAGAPVRDLVERYGSPLFVYSHVKLKDTYAAAHQAFSTRYPKVQFAWSYKTNYLRAICQAFHDLGSWAEVVSEAEYLLARSLGVEGGHIVFNGPHKSAASLERAAAEGAMINIDSYDELPQLEAIADRLGRGIDFGVRVNMSITGHATWDRFGLNIESGEAYHTIKRAITGRKLNLVGLHSHIGTFVLDSQAYRQSVRKMIELAKQLKKEFGIRLHTLDVGGGFASRNRLKGSYVPTDQIVPEFDKYAEAICSPLLDHFPQDELPLLLLETGRALIDESGYLIATVVSTKRLPSGTRAIVLDAGANLLFTAYWYDFDILPTSDKGMFTELHNVYGPLCMQIDVVGEGVRLPYLERGEQVIVRPVGAYNTTQWMQFIELRPNVVMVDGSGRAEVIRRAETVEFLTQLDAMPSWMRSGAAEAR